MPSKTYLNPDTMSQPRGYTQVVKVGNTAYIAGQVSAAPDGSVVGKGDPEAQARQIWHNLEAAVKSVGGSAQRYREDHDVCHQPQLRRRHTEGP